MTTIQQRRLGSSGPIVSPIGLGFMSFVKSADENEQRSATAVVDAALDAGVTLFDTADVYGPEHSEVLLGRALRGRRDSVVVATKFGNPIDRDTNPDARPIDGRPEYVRQAIDASLRRLGFDHVDLYYLHRVDPQVPIEDTVGALKELVEAGKIGHIGLSEPGPETLRRAHAVHPVAAVQSEWSVFSRDIETSTVPVARELGIATVPYSPLGRGWLTGAIRSREDISERRRAHPRFDTAAFDPNRALAEQVVAVANELAVTPGQVALAWLLAQGEDVIPIPGTRHTEFVTENARAAHVSLSPEHLGRLDGIASQVIGHRSARPDRLGTEAPAPAPAQ